MIIALPDDVVVHRLGGAAVANLRLKPGEVTLTPPGISTHVGGTPGEAVDNMRAVYNRSKKWQGPQTVATTTAVDIRSAGFDVIADPTPNFPNHARVVHPNGVAGFTDDNLRRLAAAFVTTSGH